MDIRMRPRSQAELSDWARQIQLAGCSPLVTPDRLGRVRLVIKKDGEEICVLQAASVVLVTRIATPTKTQMEIARALAETGVATLISAEA